MVRRLVAGLLLGLVVFGAASIVSRGLKNPGFLRPVKDSSPERLSGDLHRLAAQRAAR